MMIVFLEREKNDRVRLRGLFIFVCERGGLRYACSSSLSHTH